MADGRPGPPKGNKNRLKHGLTSRDAKFKALWASLTEEQREFLLPMVRKFGAELETIDEYVGRLEAGAVSNNHPPAWNVSPFPGVEVDGAESKQGLLSKSLLYRQTETDNNHSIPLREPQGERNGQTVYSVSEQKRLMGDLVSLGFMRAKEFVEQHVPVLQLVDDLLSEVEAFKEAGVGHGLDNPSAWVRYQFHASVMVVQGSLRQCPYCFKREYLVGVTAAKPAVGDAG